MSRATDYDDLHSHMRHHKIKQWLLDGAKREEAHTIFNAVERIPEHRLIRHLARVLAKEDFKP